jgi:undecaprenyl diphosphate synthase
VIVAVNPHVNVNVNAQVNALTDRHWTTLRVVPRIERDLQALKADVLRRPLPRHVGIIMDGNGRWAAQRGLPRLEGHRKGSDSVSEVTRAARRLGLPALTLYAFSAQNWERPPDEIEGLMDLLREYLFKERAEIMDNGIRLHAIGDLDRLPARVRQPLDELRRDSAGNSKMILTLALSYGGREEIIAMVRKVAEDKLRPEQIDAKAVEDRLWTAGLPPLVRTTNSSGEVRVSNFLLWQLAYAEIHLTETLWPDFGELDLLLALDDFQRRERRFGKTSAQLRRS